MAHAGSTIKLLDLNRSDETYKSFELNGMTPEDSNVVHAAISVATMSLTANEQLLLNSAKTNNLTDMNSILQVHAR